METATSIDFSALPEWEDMASAEKKLRRLIEDCKSYQNLAAAAENPVDTKLYENFCQRLGADEVPAARVAYDEALRALVGALNQHKDKLILDTRQRILRALRKSAVRGNLTKSDLAEVVSRGAEKIRTNTAGFVTDAAGFREYLHARMRRGWLDDQILITTLFVESCQNSHQRQQLGQKLRQMIQNDQPAAVQSEKTAAARLNKEIEQAILTWLERELADALVTAAGIEGENHATA